MCVFSSRHTARSSEEVDINSIGLAVAGRGEAAGEALAFAVADALGKRCV